MQPRMLRSVYSFVQSSKWVVRITLHGVEGCLNFLRDALSCKHVELLLQFDSSFNIRPFPNLLMPGG
jgi:hypothetical protein